MGHREAQRVLDASVPKGKFLLYRVAELVNPHNNYEYWQKPENVAPEVELTPGTVRKYMSMFVEQGWLEVTEQGGGRGNATTYRWVKTAPQGAESQTAPPVQQTAPPGRQTAPPVQKTPGIPPLLGEREETEESGARAAARELCELLAQYLVAEGVKEPTITEAWLTDMERLIRIDGNQPDAIRNCLTWIFGGGGGEWWIPNIQSPRKLRAKWAQLYLQAKRQKNGTLSKAARAVNGAAGMLPDDGKTALSAADFQPALALGAGDE